MESVLVEVAEAASETLELRDVFARVAASVRRLIPFDHITVVRIIGGEWAVRHATTAGACPDEDPDCDDPCSLATWSPRVRPRAGAIPRIDDSENELDRTFSMDVKLLEAGVRSALWEPFASKQSFTGGVWLSARRERAFTDEHQEVLRPIAALLGSAVHHWQIWDAERRRRERNDRLEGLLATIAESLDVRDVFERISDAVRPVLTHDLLALTELEGDGRTFRIVADAGDADVEAPTGPVSLTEEESSKREDYEIFRDIPTEVSPTTDRNRLLLATGMRSWLRVPLRLAGVVTGSIVFLHRDPSRYGTDDVEAARRVADRMALALSHHRLAEEARVAAEAREHARRLEATVETLTRELESQGRRVVGVSRSWKEVLLQVQRVASSDTTALITGESGTGKEVVARLIQQGSPRAGKPFVAINCAALPDQLLESELFGHEKGAFTGAVATKVGRLEQASGGTLFLDEIAEMSPLVQAKFLRVLQEREFQRLGGTRTLRADVRVIAATNRELQSAIEKGQFREDLYYRLNVFQIPIPPLRARKEDILPLAESFFEDLGSKMARPSAGISKDARAWLLEYHWPGNVRELRNAIERAILLCDGGLITRSHLPNGNGHKEANGRRDALDLATPLPAAGVDLAALDKSMVEKALQQTRGNKSRAARLLGLSRSQLYSRLDKYHLDY